MSNLNFTSACPYSILETDDMEVVEQHLLEAQKNDIVLLDVDDTLITPSSKSCQGYDSMIDQIKQNHTQYPNFLEILSQWRLQRQVICVEPRWPALIETLKQKAVVYALTQMQSGGLGAIPCMQKWRFQELNDMSIQFTPNFNNETEFFVYPFEENKNPAVFYQGIFITGSYRKGQIVKKIIETQPKSPLLTIYCVDDRADHVEDVGQICAQLGISYLGIVFTKIIKDRITLDPRIVEIQKEFLLNHLKWLEDNEALDQLNILSMNYV